MFSGVRSDSEALSHMWLGLPGGRFQSEEEASCSTMCKLHYLESELPLL